MMKQKKSLISDNFSFVFMEIAINDASIK